ncbi:DUF4142 domain-containing protein [Streptomyces sp. WMMB 322]|uniref:DUF4142 domain-containing protein n=1 Tax=Streptomyces sp. WMMB 322 TaxID=1286821 RepID=UPI0006E123B8|nr:DUF4142 domain-containing protein [Streptomyces sp. WMMB 322]SCK09110.1 Predicted outer membrane protein [Streptomyces sp. WMMB 322]
MRSIKPSGRVAGTALVLLGFVATLVSLLVPVYFFDGNRTIALSRAGWQDDGKGTWKTKYGPLTALDRDFLRSVRSAGLWKVPAGRAARERGTQKTVRAVGDRVVEACSDLDKRAIEAGRTLKVTLPNQPTDAQRQYMSEIEKAKGKKFDEVFVNRVRKHDGQMFGLVGLVRDQTRNSMVRSLATKANSVVLDHIAVLEGTGLVDSDAISQGE